MNPKPPLAFKVSCQGMTYGLKFKVSCQGMTYGLKWPEPRDSGH